MYAVIKTGGKQYRVAPGAKLKVEMLEAEVGAEIQFREVLLITEGDANTFGTPFINNAVVTAVVLAQARDKKVTIIKFRRRKHHMKKMGHRQYYTQVQITAISK